MHLDLVSKLHGSLVVFALSTVLAFAYALKKT
jgi:hypothetical protein